MRFKPGTSRITLVAGIGHNLRQRFIIDTGASLVTVPAATARRLGLDLSLGRRRRFYSATGVRDAIEVTLPQIEIDGWVVEEVQALVVDLPGHPGVGLLGMNFLRHFQVDVDSRRGFLRLTPRG